jgi:cytochrome P450
MLCMASDGHANQHADGDPQRPQPHEFAAHAHLQRKEPHMSATTLETAMDSANAAEAPIPTGVQLTPFDGAFLNDPYPVLKQLRDAEPIHRDNALSRWFVTGFDNVREVLRNKDLSNDINRAPGRGECHDERSHRERHQSIAPAPGPACSAARPAGADRQRR